MYNPPQNPLQFYKLTHHNANDTIITTNSGLNRNKQQVDNDYQINQYPFKF